MKTALSSAVQSKSQQQLISHPFPVRSHGQGDNSVTDATCVGGKVGRAVVVVVGACVVAVGAGVVVGVVVVVSVTFIVVVSGTVVVIVDVGV